MTPEQLRRMEIARLKAKARQEQTDAGSRRDARTGDMHDPQTGDKRKASQDSASNSKPGPMFKPYIEYDLSRIQDTKGGYLVDDGQSETAQREAEMARRREAQRRRLVSEPIIALDPTARPLCRECKESPELIPEFRDVFGVNVCRKCRGELPDSYSLLTKTECKEDYLLTEPELRDEELLPHLLKANPHRATFSNMMLYLRCQVEAYAFKKWGGPEGLDAEYERRTSDKARRRDAKFAKSLQDLRKRTITSDWSKRSKREADQHEHEFSAGIRDDETGVTVRRCTCGLTTEEYVF